MFSTVMSSLGAKVAAAATAAALLAGGAAGASAAFGGPNVASSVHDVVTQSEHSGDSGSDNELTDQGGENSGHGHETCSEATQHALARLKELQADGRPVDNAIQAVENCGNGSDGTDAEDSAETEDQDSHANPNADEKSGNSDDGIDNSGDHAENGKSHANSRAFDGSGNAGLETEGDAD